MAMQLQYLNSCVYKLIATKENDTKAAVKQYNNPLQVLGVEITRAHDTTYNNIKEHFEELYKDAEHSLVVMAAYPYTKEMQDTIMNYTYAQGYMVEWKKYDRDEPYIIPEDISEEEKQKIKEERELPYPEIHPFVFMFPETAHFMFTISLDFAPHTAIEYHDGSTPDNTEAAKKSFEEAMAEPATPNILFDPTVFISPEDRERMQQELVDQIQKDIDKELESNNN